jgi:hypothetical protein
MANWFVLICAVLASLSAGVALAYGVCVTLFTLFRAHSQSVATTRQAAIVGS